MRIVFRADGPMLIEAEKGQVVYLNGHPVVLEKKNLALCRCGASKRKPFCDKSHREIGFKAPATVLEWDEAPGKKG